MAAPILVPLAALLLSSRRTLLPLAREPAEDGRVSPSRKKALTRRLLDSVIQHPSLGEHPLHQLRAAAGAMQARAGRIEALHGAGPGDPGALVVAATDVLAGALFRWQNGHLVFREQAFTRYQDLAERLWLDPLVAFCHTWEGAADGLEHPAPRAHPADPARWVRGTLLPRPAGIAEEGERAEVHRHLTFGRLPSLTVGQLRRSLRAMCQQGQGRDPVPSLDGFDYHALRATAEAAHWLGHALPGGPVEPHEADLRRLARHAAGSPDIATALWLHREASGPLHTPTALGAQVQRRRLHRAWLTLADATPARRLAFLLHVVTTGLLLRAMVHPRRGHEGLQRFIEGFARPALAGDVPRLQQHVLTQAWRTGSVHYLEPRVSTRGPEQGRHGAIAWRIRAVTRAAAAADRRGSGWVPRYLAPPFRPADLLRSNPDAGRPATGIVLHFLREPEPPPPRSPYVRQVRHHRLRRAVWAQAVAIQRLLHHPSYGPAIVGLDVANDEVGASIEVFAPALRALRASRNAHGHLQLPGDPRQPDRTIVLGLCCHAGEDFHHLLGGIRSAVETVDFCDYHEGDRVGHALALGLSWSGWSDRMGGSAWVPRGEWLLDLLAFLERIDRLSRSHLQHVRNDVVDAIHELAVQVFPAGGSDGPDTDLRTLQVFRRLRRLDAALLPRFDGQASAMLPDLRRRAWAELRDARDDHPAAFALLRRWHLDPAVQERARAFIAAPIPPAWADAVARVQDDVVRELTERRIAIEVNPSSNLRLGAFDHPEDHPVFRWHPPGATEDSAAWVVVGTDDPEIFATELVHEYALLGEAASRRGHGARQVDRWLDELRAQGVRFSFVRRAASHLPPPGPT